MRRVTLTITEEGRAALQHDRRHRAAWIAEAIAARLTDAERTALADLPRLLRTLSGDAGSERRPPPTERQGLPANTSSIHR